MVPGRLPERSPEDPGPSALASFDVFDTVLVRSWMRPADLFDAVGEALRDAGLWSGEAARWARERAAVELQLRRSAGTEEVVLADIHVALARALGLPPEVAAKAEALEVEMERRAVHAVAAARDVIDAARGRGERVCFVSDTYLSAGVVADLLSNAGISPAEPGRSVFASASEGVTKRTGRLYGRLRERLRAPGQSWTHVGDSREADVEAARRAGVASTHWTVTAVHPRERALHRAFGADHARLGSAVAGAARSARLAAPAGTGAGDVIERTAASVFGPVLAAFAAWCLLQARRLRHERIHFLARDGQIVREIALRLMAATGDGPECRYLLGSRQALHLPSLQSFDDDFRKWFLAGAAGRTRAQLLARLRLDASHPAVAALGDPGERLDDDSARALADLVQSDPILRAEVLGTAAEQRAMLLEYLADEGLRPSERALLVDVGWLGRMQQSLWRILASAGHRPPEIDGLYFGLIATPYASPGSRYIGFHPQAGRLNVPMTEVMTAADHGSVTGYRRDAGGRVVGVLASARNEQALEWGLDRMRAGIHRYLDHLLATTPARWWQSDEAIRTWQRAASLTLLQFMEYPEVDEAIAFGDFGASDDQLHSEFSAIAPAVPVTGLLRAVARRGGGGPTRWISGSIARSVSRPLARAGLLGAAALRARAAGRWKRG